MNEPIRNYFAGRLPMEVSAQQHFRLLRSVFVLVFASTVIVHLLLGEDAQPMGMLVHATAIGLTYTVSVGIASALLHSLRHATPHVLVWHVWSASLAGFVLGYFFLPLDALMGLFGNGGSHFHSASMGFLQLAPIWLIVTYLFVQPYLTEGLKSELQRLQNLNAMLDARRAGREPDEQRIRFRSGRNEFSLRAGDIRNIVVDDHYCYLHYATEQGYAKRDLALPLRDLAALLPEEFLRVHRSHIVNLNHIVSIDRKNRAIRVVLDGDCEIPVSRHRLEQVLPLLRQRVEERR